MIKLRASSMPDFMTCAPSVMNPERFVEVETEVEAAGLGTLIHEFCQRIVETGEYDTRELLARYPDDAVRAAILIGNFAQVYREARPSMPKPRTELFHEMVLEEGLGLSGHIDLCQIGDDSALVLDYKTGRLHDNHFHQVIAYALLLWDYVGRRSEYTVRISVVYLEDLTVTNYAFTVADLKKWWNEVLDKSKDMRYTVSRKCAFCSIQGSCPAYREYNASTMEVLGSDRNWSWKSMPVAERGPLLDRLYVLKKAIFQAETALKAQAGQGALDLGDGTVYTRIEQNEQSLNAKALPILRERFDAALLDEVAEYPLNKVLDMVAKYSRTQKLLARETWTTKFARAGAIEGKKKYFYARRPKNEGTLTTEESNEQPNDNARE